MRTRIAACSVVWILVAAAAAAQPPGDATTERLSLEAAPRLAIENNRQLQTARLQVEKADADRRGPDETPAGARDRGDGIVPGVARRVRLSAGRLR